MCTLPASLSTLLTMTLSVVSNDGVVLPLMTEPAEFTEVLSFSLHSLEELETEPDRFLCFLRFRRLRDLSFSGLSPSLSTWLFTVDDRGGKLSTSGDVVVGGLQHGRNIL